MVMRNKGLLSFRNYFILISILFVVFIGFIALLRHGGVRETLRVSPYFYVDINNDGCDDNGLGTEEQPWCSINKAIRTLQTGQTVYVKPGVYDISLGPFTETGLWPFDEQPYPALIRPMNSGIDGSPIRVIALSTARDIIGGGNAPEGQDDGNQVFIVNGVIYVDKDYWQFEGFYTRDGGGFFSKDNNNFLLKDSLIFVEPNSLFDVGGGYRLQLYNSNNSVIDHIEGWSINLDAFRQGSCIDETRNNIISIFDSSNVVVRNSLIYGGRSNLYFKSSDNFIVENNVIFWAQEHNSEASENSADWAYRYNIFSGTGQESPFIVAHCDTTNVNGVVHNNLALLITGPHIETYCNSDPDYSGVSDMIFRNNLVIQERSSYPCFLSWPPDVNVVDSDYNYCIYRTASSSKRWWMITTTDYWWDIDEWQTQSEFPQVNQDPNSFYGFNTDPGFGTPLDELGQKEGDDYDCSFYLPSYCEEGLISNCKPPFRMRLLDDFSLSRDSILIGSGDPLYGGGNIGPFVYEEQPSGEVDSRLPLPYEQQ